MSLTIDGVRKIATLAQLELGPGEEVVLTEQLARIVGYVDQLQAAEQVEPMLEAGSSSLARDEPRPCLERATFLANAPQHQDGYLVVPKVKKVGKGTAGGGG